MILSSPRFEMDRPPDDDLPCGQRGRAAGEWGPEQQAQRRGLGPPSSHEARAAPEEGALVRRLAAGDVTALTAIAEWLWEPLAAYAYRIVGDEDIARDIAQEACVRLWEGRGKTPPTSLRPYLFRIARNLALDHSKTRRTRERLLRRYGLDHAWRPAAPDEVLERGHVMDEIQSAIQALPERRREVFVLAYLRGLSYAEIAEVMSISPKTVQNHMTAALTELRTVLRPLIEERRKACVGAVRRNHDVR
jgi:RNA polymerase sigma-70 factor (ECF subfamily)